MIYRPAGKPTRRRSIGGKVNIYFRWLKALNKPAIFIFPKLVVCPGCGLTQFKLEGQQVELLRDNVVSERITQ
jgi:hypothetical protein